MTTLLVTGEYPPQAGGIGDYTSQLAHALQQRGEIVAVVTGQADAAPQGSIPVFRTVQRWNWSAWEAVLAAALEVRPDAIHIEYQPAAFGLHAGITFLPRQLRKAGVPAVLGVTFHDLQAPHAFTGSGLLDQSFVRRLARSVDLAVCSEEIDARDVEAWRKHAPTCVIPIGSNIPRLPLAPGERALVRSRAGAGDDDLLVGFFGFANQTKGIETLARAFAAYRSRDPAARLVFIGDALGASDAANQRTLAATATAIDALGLGGAVHRTGALSHHDVSRWLQALDALVLPYEDGWSWRRGTLLAGLTSGAAVITTSGAADRTSQGALPRLTHGRDALLVPARDPEAIASALRQLASTPLLRRALGEGALEIASQFSWDRIAADHVAAWQAAGS